MDTIEKRLQAVKSRIARALEQSGQPQREILLVAVSKGQSAGAIEEAFAAGQRDFAESYAQEAAAKMQSLGALPIVWHFVGPLQSNKTRTLAERFHWVHSVDRPKLAERLSAQRGALPSLQVCIQVNLSGEASKAGCRPDEAAGLARAVARLPGLQLRGLMTVPEPGASLARFAALTNLFKSIKSDGLALDTLSMGMSDDMDTAIAAGSTLVRVGTAIFGPRRPRSSAA